MRSTAVRYESVNCLLQAVRFAVVVVQRTSQLQLEVELEGCHCHCYHQCEGILDGGDGPPAKGEGRGCVRRSPRRAASTTWGVLKARVPHRVLGVRAANSSGVLTRHFLRALFHTQGTHPLREIIFAYNRAEHDVLRALLTNCLPCF